MKVLWIGEIVLDKTYIINWDINSWQKCQSCDSEISIWWPVPSALKLLSNLWVETTIVGSIWKWPLWRYVKEQFDLYGITHELILDKATKVNTVVVDEKTWSRTIIKDKIHNTSIKYISESLIREADLIIFDRSEKEIFDFVIKNKRDDTLVIVDPSTEYSKEVFHMVRNSFIPIFPIETVYKMSDEIDFLVNLKRLNDEMWKAIVITDWENWSYLYDSWELKNFEALNICPVDANWAWDVFRWWFAYGLLQKRSIEDCIVFANKVAWLQCTKKWNLTAVPSLEEINDFSF